jgi:hypothetical protein
MLDVLHKYKEMITLMVFFMGGFFWLQREYASKNELTQQLSLTNQRIARLNCLLEANIDGVTAQLKLRILPVSIEQAEFKLATLQANVTSMSPVHQDLLQSAKRQLEIYRDELQKIKVDSEQLLKRSGKCAAVDA